MKLPQLPQPEQVLQRIRPLTTALYEIFPEAAQQALPYFHSRGREVNRALIVCMLRYEVKQQLLQADFQVEDDEPEEVPPTDLSLEALANNGLACTYNGVRLKVLKSDDGRLPVPGLSKRRQAFYAQQLEFTGVGFGNSGQDETESAPSSICLNVVVLWRFDPSYSVVELRLAAPKAGDLSRASVEEYWNVEIPHSAIGGRFEPMDKREDIIVEPEITRKLEETIGERHKDVSEQQ